MARLIRLAALLCLAFAGCATYVRPPFNPPRPTTVFIANYGIHSSVLLPTPRGEYVEYAFGDWGPFVDNQNNLPSYIKAAFFSTQAAFGRRYLALDLAESDDALANRVTTYQLLRFAVSKDRADALLARLDARYARAEATPA